LEDGDEVLREEGCSKQNSNWKYKYPITYGPVVAGRLDGSCVGG
jgi:hypothetical protein